MPDPKTLSSAHQVAARRATRADLFPYSREIARELEALCGAVETETLPTGVHPIFDVVLPARTLMVDRALRDSQITQVVEVGAGFSPRGLWITDDPAATFVHLDFPENSRTMQEIVHRIAPGRTNYHFIEGDARQPETLQAAFDLFDPARPVAVIYEGIWRFFKLEEKRAGLVTCQQAHAAVFTVDVTLKAGFPAEGLARLGPDSSHFFESLEEAQTLFKSAGYELAQLRPLTDVVELLSLPTEDDGGLLDLGHGMLAQRYFARLEPGGRV